MSASSVPPSTYEELSIHQSLLFLDSIKDLKSLRSQLYSAAEYFELTYHQDDQKKIVVNTLKDYAIKALVNTIDHLGSVSYKVNGLLDDKFDDFSDTEFRVSCIEQRLGTCQEYIDQQGLSQQSLQITPPTFHKHYAIPASIKLVESGGQATPKCREFHRAKADDEFHQFHSAIHSSRKERQSSFRNASTTSRSPRARSSSPKKESETSPSPVPGKFSFKEKRAPSPLSRSGSLSRKLSILSNSSNIGRQLSSQPQKSMSMRLHSERIVIKENEQGSTKSRSILKTLLSRRRSKKDEKFFDRLG